MYYILTSNEELFKKWRELEELTHNSKRLGSAVVQNNMILPSDEMDRAFWELNDAIASLSQVYAPQIIEKAYKLRDETLVFIKNLQQRQWGCEAIHTEFWGTCPYEAVKEHIHTHSKTVHQTGVCPLLTELSRTADFVKSWNIPQGS